MDTEKFGVLKTDLLQFSKGQQKASELIKDEKIKRLRKLTTKESLQEYDTLCAIWEMNERKEGIEFLEKKKIAFLIEKRNTFNKIGGLGGDK